MRTITVILSGSASCAQDYLTNHTKDLDKIRGLWTVIAQRREALAVCGYFLLALSIALSPAWLAIRALLR